MRHFDAVNALELFESLARQRVTPIQASILLAGGKENGGSTAEVADRTRMNRKVIQRNMKYMSDQGFLGGQQRKAGSRYKLTTEGMRFVQQILKPDAA